MFYGKLDRPSKELLEAYAHKKILIEKNSKIRDIIRFALTLHFGNEQSKTDITSR